MAKPTGGKGTHKGDGSIYWVNQRGGFWQGSVVIPGSGGKRRTVSDRNKMVCLEKLVELRKAVRSEIDPTQTLGDFLSWWLGVQEARVGTGPDEKSVNTFEQDRWAVEIVTAKLGTKLLRDLSPVHVELLLAHAGALEQFVIIRPRCVRRQQRRRIRARLAGLHERH